MTMDDVDTRGPRPNTGLVGRIVAGLAGLALLAVSTFAGVTSTEHYLHELDAARAGYQQAADARTTAEAALDSADGVWGVAVDRARRTMGAAGDQLFTVQALDYLSADRVTTSIEAANGIADWLLNRTASDFPATVRPPTVPQPPLDGRAGLTELREGTGDAEAAASADDEDAQELLAAAAALKSSIASVDAVWQQLDKGAANPGAVLATVTRADQAQKDRIVRDAAAIGGLLVPFSEAAAPTWAEYFSAIADARSTEATRFAAEQAAAAAQAAESSDAAPSENADIFGFRQKCLDAGGTITVLPDGMSCDKDILFSRLPFLP